MNRHIYLDNNASTPTDPRVVEAMTRCLSEDFGNASSLHLFGQRARAAVEEARREVSRLIGARPGEIVFTSGGTEADNTAIRGIALQLADRGNHLVTTTIEHPAVLSACRDLEEEGFRVTYVPVDKNGILRLNHLEEALCDETILVSAMYANNETGVLQPLSEISSLTRERDILLHSDAVQAIGKIPVDVRELGIDLLSLTGHKFHGPKGAGALYVRRGVKIKPMAVGGGHEHGLRGGTENVPAIVGLGQACTIAAAEFPEFPQNVSRLRDKLQDGILDGIPDTVLNGSRERRTPQTANVSFVGIDGEALLMALDFKGVAVSTGAACHSGSHSASHVLKAMGLDRQLLQGAIRFSLGRMNTEDEIDRVLEILPKLVREGRDKSLSYRS